MFVLNRNKEFECNLTSAGARSTRCCVYVTPRVAVVLHAARQDIYSGDEAFSVIIPYYYVTSLGYKRTGKLGRHLRIQLTSDSIEVNN